MNQLAKLVATWFGSGLLPGAPGTWGSLAALPFAVLWVWLGGAWALSAATIAAFVVGVWASGRYATAIATEDPGSAVIDEVAGQWLALIPAALDWRLFVVAFVAFRAADIVKPWPGAAGRTAGRRRRHHGGRHRRRHLCRHRHLDRRSPPPAARRRLGRFIHD